jgi:glycosyltransferase involved in cell wall biosynthesis
MTFSIITPSLNQAAYLPECIASVSDQFAATPGDKPPTDPVAAPPPAVEHLVIDGGSTDGTLDLLRAHPHLHWISEPDRGQSHAINKGLALATGDILAYLCADDFYEPTALAAVHDIFAKNPDVDVVHADFFFLEGRSGRKRLKHSTPLITPSLLENHNPLGQPAVWWRRRVHERFGGFDESLHYCMDHEYWLRIAPHTRWHRLPMPLATCRLHPDAKTSSKLPAAWHETARMLTRSRFRIKPWWDYWNMLLWGQYHYRAKRLWFSRPPHRSPTRH